MSIDPSLRKTGPDTERDGAQLRLGGVPSFSRRR